MDARADREQAIRQRAYFLWLDGGMPNGQADAHWLAAEAALLADDALDDKSTRAPRAAPSLTCAASPQRSRLGAHLWGMAARLVQAAARLIFPSGRERFA